MKKLDSKLFSKFEIHKVEAQLVVGGNYTASDTDTCHLDGSYDITACTDLGDESVIDVAMTGSDIRDMPKSLSLTQ